MRDVVIIGTGQTPVGEHWTRSLRHLAHDAIMPAMADAGVEAAGALYVGNMLSGQLIEQEHLGALIADFVGLRGIEAMKIEAACASGAAALRAGYMAVASGLQDVVLVCGVEKMTDTPGADTTTALATAADQEYEISEGVSFVALNALLMRRYMHEHKLTKEVFAPYTINAHRNGSNNPNAMFRSPVSAAAYAKAGHDCRSDQLAGLQPYLRRGGLCGPRTGRRLQEPRPSQDRGIERCHRQPGSARPPRSTHVGCRGHFEP